jgi:hypothetical protein
MFAFIARLFRRTPTSYTGRPSPELMRFMQADARRRLMQGTAASKPASKPTVPRPHDCREAIAHDEAKHLSRRDDDSTNAAMLLALGAMPSAVDYDQSPSFMGEGGSFGGGGASGSWDSSSGSSLDSPSSYTPDSSGSSDSSSCSDSSSSSDSSSCGSDS